MKRDHTAPARLQYQISDSGFTDDGRRVRHPLPLGSHDLFVGEVVAVQVSRSVLDEHGRVDNSTLRPILFTGDQYWGVGELLGRYGFRKAG